MVKAAVLKLAGEKPLLSSPTVAIDGPQSRHSAPLSEDEKGRRKDAMDVLIVMLENIITNPNVEKFKRVRTDNKVFTRRVLSVPGGQEFLKAVGFEERNGSYEFVRNDIGLLWLGKSLLEEWIAKMH